MEQKELKAEMRNKLQSLRTIVEQLNKEKKIPVSIVQISMEDLTALEKLVDCIS